MSGVVALLESASKICANAQNLPTVPIANSYGWVLRLLAVEMHATEMANVCSTVVFASLLSLENSVKCLLLSLALATAVELVHATWAVVSALPEALASIAPRKIFASVVVATDCASMEPVSALRVGWAPSATQVRLVPQFPTCNFEKPQIHLFHFQV